MCSTLRPAGSRVHDEARGEGARYGERSPPCPLDRRAPTASTDSTYVGTSSAEMDGARGGRRRAECTSLSPASYCVSFPFLSASSLGVRLRACGRCGFGSAVRRSAALPVDVLDGPVGAAQQQLRNGVGIAIARGKV
jgi:hypothetical protein